MSFDHAQNLRRHRFSEFRLNPPFPCDQFADSGGGNAFRFFRRLHPLNILRQRSQKAAFLYHSVNVIFSPLQTDDAELFCDFAHVKPLVFQLRKLVRSNQQFRLDSFLSFPIRSLSSKASVLRRLSASPGAPYPGRQSLFPARCGYKPPSKGRKPQFPVRSSPWRISPDSDGPVWVD